MKNLKAIVIILGFIITACDTNTGSQNGSNNQILINDIEIIDIQCLHWSAIGKTMIIDNDSDYQELRHFKMSYKDTCQEVILPEIDFDKRTLLGMNTYCGGCCMPEYEYVVEKDEPQKQYKLIINQTQKGQCKMYLNRFHWISIPKKEIEYKVVFEQKVVAIDTCG